METKALLVNPTEYFREQVTAATGSLQIKLEPHVEFYLVNLLCQFIQPEKQFANQDDTFNQPLVTMLQRAYDAASTEQKLQILRNVGDTTLYVAGYFQDYFNRKTFDVGYYIEVGSIAYENVSDLLKSKSETHQVYSDLARNFTKMVDVVAEIAESQNPTDNKDVLAVYDRWARSHSDRLRKILRNLGIEPIETPIKIAQ